MALLFRLLMVALIAFGAIATFRWLFGGASRSKVKCATCAHCHVPHHNWVATLWRKTRASFNELPSNLMGKIDTVEKFEAHRKEMAEAVWAEMQANDSRECRYCHNREAMVLADQSTRARKQHENAQKEGETCIDCHDGLVHNLPETEEKEESEGFTFD